jgi:signal peptidase I
MTDDDSFWDWPEDEGVGAGNGQPRRHFDPLFPAWDDDQGDAQASPATSEGSDFLTPDSEGAWGDSGLVALWATPVGAGKPTSWYATRWQEAHAPYLTEAQLRLRAGVITVPHPTHRRRAVMVRELAETLLLALLIFLSVRASFQNFRVEGISMQPSLEDGEYLIVNKLSYAQLDRSIFNFLPFYEASADPVTHLWGKPDRGDVIVFRAPTNPDRDFIKRIIGLPGDTIEIRTGGAVILNGETLNEPYINNDPKCTGTICDAPILIPAEGSPEAHAQCGSDACYFVMGDNRGNSSDSRQGWLVPEENIIGKALMTYWHEGGPEFDAAPNHSVSADEPDDQ